MGSAKGGLEWAGAPQVLVMGAYGRRMKSNPRQYWPQRNACVRAQKHQRLRRHGGHNAASGVAAFWPQVNDPVGLGDHVQVVLDHDHAVAGIDQAVQHADELVHVGHVQAHSGFVQHIERVRCLVAALAHFVAHLGQLGHQLDALGFAATERG